MCETLFVYMVRIILGKKASTIMCSNHWFLCGINAYYHTQKFGVADCENRCHVHVSMLHTITFHHIFYCPLLVVYFIGEGVVAAMDTIWFIFCFTYLIIL